MGGLPTSIATNGAYFSHSGTWRFVSKKTRKMHKLKNNDLFFAFAFEMCGRSEKCANCMLRHVHFRINYIKIIVENTNH